MNFLIAIVLDVNPNPGKGTFGRPYDSTQGFSSNEILTISFVILVFASYVGLRVWKSLRYEKTKMANNSKFKRNKKRRSLRARQNCLDMIRRMKRSI